MTLYGTYHAASHATRQNLPGYLLFPKTRHPDTNATVGNEEVMAMNLRRTTRAILNHLP